MARASSDLFGKTRAHCSRKTPAHVFTAAPVGHCPDEQQRVPLGTLPDGLPRTRLSTCTMAASSASSIVAITRKASQWMRTRMI